METRQLVEVFDFARGAMRRDLSRRGFGDEAIASSMADFNAALTELEHGGWKRGWDLGTGFARRSDDETAELLLQVAAKLRGKDRADGEVSFTIYPDPRIYEWKPEV